jgi:hypothetical protein
MIVGVFVADTSVEELEALSSVAEHISSFALLTIGE